MTNQSSALITSGYDNPGSGLTRLRMGDEIFSARNDAGNGAGAGGIIVRRDELDPLPRPPGPMGLTAKMAG